MRSILRIPFLDSAQDIDAGEKYVYNFRIELGPGFGLDGLQHVCFTPGFFVNPGGREGI